MKEQREDNWLAQDPGYLIEESQVRIVIKLMMKTLRVMKKLGFKVTSR